MNKKHYNFINGLIKKIKLIKNKNENYGVTDECQLYKILSFDRCMFY